MGNHPVRTGSDAARSGHMLITCEGALRVETVVPAIAAAYASGRMTPGGTRIVHIAEGCSLANLTHDALRQIQATVLAQETAGRRTPCWATALVDPNPLHRGMLHLYKALWDSQNLSQVHCAVHETLSDAAAWLDTRQAAARGL